jgi:NADPH:quinone reductase-like Zn-dependent oxidoreductase
MKVIEVPASFDLRDIMPVERPELEDLRWLDLKRLHPIIDRTFPFQDSNAAFLHLKAGGHIGKVRVVM